MKSADVSPRLFHPLAGAGLVHLSRLLWRNRPVDPSALPAVAVALASAVARVPFGLLERLRVVQLRRRTPTAPPPIFIVGHWRSGTTHLYNLLGTSPDFGYVTPLATGLPGEFLALGRLISPVLEHALPSDRFIDRMPVRPDSPQEDETAIANLHRLSFYHGLFFPYRFREHFRRGVFLEGCSEEEVRGWERRFTDFLEKVSLDQGGRRLLIKNPVYTARVARLRSLYPGAKFIHIHRNPYIVFQSTRNFYRALFEELALQDWNHLDVDDVILESYPRMLHSFLEDAARLPEADCVEVRFEDLERRPLETARRIYERLELEGFERARNGFEAYLRSVADYRKNRYRFPPRDIERVQSHWGEFLERWDYASPENTSETAAPEETSEAGTG